MSQYAIVTDLNRCVGCMACMVACKAVNDVEIGSYWNKLLRVGPSKKAEFNRSSDVEMYYLPVQCQHCANPECVNVCPTGASVKMDDGTVQIDSTVCIGCGLCLDACPYGVRYLSGEGVAEKCNLCQDVVADGMLPQCVAQCGGRARYFGDLDNGIESFETPEIAYVAERGTGDVSYEGLKTGFRVKLGDKALPFAPEDVYQLDDSGNGPSMYYILRNREWKTGQVMQPGSIKAGDLCVENG